MGNRAVASHIGAPVVLRDTGQTASIKTVGVTVSWKQKPPKTYLRDAFKTDPPDWHADVYAQPGGGEMAKLGNGDGSLTVNLVKDQKYVIKVILTGKAESADYYHKSATLRGYVAKAGKATVTLKYNRWSKLFTKQSWENAGLDPIKAGNTTQASMFGRSVRVNQLVKPRVAATNAYFEGPQLTDTEREEVRDSIVSMGGYAERTTSTGAYSNHSTGCAVDINAHGPTWQNHHFKKSKDKKKKNEHEKVLSLVALVVGDDGDWQGYDPWKETGADRILAASQRFNARFPGYLAGLLDEAVGRGWRSEQLLPDEEEFISPGIWSQILTQMRRDEALESGLLVQIVTPTLLRKAAKKAKKDSKTDVSDRLNKIADHWVKIRAWVEGIVVYGRKINNKTWAYASEHEDMILKPAIKGRLQGMVSLHPKLVESLIEGGWTWLVDYTAKDFMHFEDRKAQEAIKLKK